MATATFPRSGQRCQRRHLPLHETAPCHLPLRLRPRAAHPFDCKLHSSVPEHPLRLLRSTSITTRLGSHAGALSWSCPRCSRPTRVPVPGAGQPGAPTAAVTALVAAAPPLLENSSSLFPSCFQTASQLPGELHRHPSLICHHRPEIQKLINLLLVAGWLLGPTAQCKGDGAAKPLAPAGPMLPGAAPSPACPWGPALLEGTHRKQRRHLLCTETVRLPRQKGQARAEPRACVPATTKRC